MNKKVLLSTVLAGLLAGGAQLSSTNALADHHEGKKEEHAAEAHDQGKDHGKKKKDKKAKKHAAKKADAAGDKNSCSGKDGCNHPEGEAKAEGAGEHK